MATTTAESSSNSGSAKIYAFPPRGRFALREQPGELPSAANVELSRGEKKMVSGSGWYHDAAIADDKPKRNS